MFGIFNSRWVIVSDLKLAISLVVDLYGLQLVNADVEFCDGLLFVVDIENYADLQVEFVFLFMSQFVGHRPSFIL